MTNLEWINKQIANINDVIKVNQIRLDENQLYEILKEHYQAYHKDLVELIQTLQQIKAELEAWYVVKPYVDIVDKYTPYPTWQLKPNYDECKLKDTNALIKALEVEDEL